MRLLPESPAERVAWLALGALTVAPLAASPALPFVDLPQHEAAVAILRRYAADACGVSGLYELKAFTPYWGGYGLAFLLSIPFGVALAWKLLVGAALLALPLATRALLAEVGGEPRLALAAFAASYGFVTSWGFVTFLLAVPIALLAVAQAYRFARGPDRREGAKLATLLVLLFTFHALAFAAAWAIAAALVGLARSSTPRSDHTGFGKLGRLAPLLPSFALALAWLAMTRGLEAEESARSLYLLGWNRFAELAVDLTGEPGRGRAALLVALLLGTLAATGVRPARSFVRWLPFAGVLAFVLLGPNLAFGTAYLAPRFTILLLPLLLAAFDPADALPAPRRRDLRAAGRAGVAATTALILVVAAIRLARLDRDGAGLGEILAVIPDDARVLYLPYERSSPASDRAVFLHSGQRYLLDHCGIVESSFARHFQIPIRYRDGAALPLPRSLPLVPHRFRWNEHAGDRYDAFLVRSANAPDAEHIAGAPGRLRLAEHRGRWWLLVPVASPPRS